MRQDFNTQGLIHKISDQISHLSKFVQLNEGDMILTGTGDGSSAVKVGDTLEAAMFEQESKLLSLTTPII